MTIIILAGTLLFALGLRVGQWLGRVQQMGVELRRAR